MKSSVTGFQGVYRFVGGISFLSMLLLEVITSAQESTPLLETVRREAPIGWKRLVEERQLLHVTGTAANPGAPSFQESKVRGTHRLFILEDATSQRQSGPGQMPVVRVLGVNDRYAFELNATNRNGPYRLARLRALDPSRPLEAAEWNTLNVLSTDIVYKPIMIACLPLPELVHHPSFQWLGAEEIQEGNARFVRCQCQWDAEAERGKGCSLFLEGPRTLDLDPKNHYRLLRFAGTSVFNGEKYQVIQEHTYDGNRLVRTSWKSVRASDGAVIAEDKLAFQYVTDKAPDPSEFYLTAFGLPEPPNPKEPSVLPWFWLMGGLVFLLAGALLLVWSRLRRTAT
ncbi:MAG: hypothetical protein KatS3mg110_4281 [Pirellulaceae bacterium]|nr:MAG: hypothetical protein KatS3mg110_4281 [Pirellulaceae bacterium]